MKSIYCSFLQFPASRADLSWCCMQKADLWSCGIILYALLYGHHPFNAYSKEYIGKVVRGEYTIPDRPSVSAECVQLLKRLLQTDPSQRISLQQVMELPWFQIELPDGCLIMNDWYCAASKPPLDQVWTGGHQYIFFTCHVMPRVALLGSTHHSKSLTRALLHQRVVGAEQYSLHLLSCAILTMLSCGACLHVDRVSDLCCHCYCCHKGLKSILQNACMKFAHYIGTCAEVLSDATPQLH